MTARMRYGNHERLVLIGDECDVETPARNSSVGRNLPKPGKDFSRGNRFRVAGLKARDTSSDLCLPCRFGSGLRLQIHALQKLTRQRKALVGRQNKCVMGDGIEGGRHEDTIMWRLELSSFETQRKMT